MEMEFWDEIEGIGKLYVEEELVVGIEPVLLVCVDAAQNNRYLVMTYNSSEGEYVFCRIDSKALIAMLDNRKTMEETFRAAGRIYMTRALTDDLLQATPYKANEFPAERLPDKGAYYDISSDYIRKYVEKLKDRQDMINIVMEIYEKIRKINMSLSGSDRKPNVKYELGFLKGEKYITDHIDMHNKKYSLDSSKYFAA